MGFVTSSTSGGFTGIRQELRTDDLAIAKVYPVAMEKVVRVVVAAAALLQAERDHGGVAAERRCGTP